VFRAEEPVLDAAAGGVIARLVVIAWQESRVNYHALDAPQPFGVVILHRSIRDAHPFPILFARNNLRLDESI
jgi:hypothetical protein